MTDKNLPTPDELRKLLRYEPETGRLFWRERSAKDYQHTKDPKRCAASFNARDAGTPALTCINSWGYLSGAVWRRSLLAHRVIWAIVHGRWPEDEIDHINGDKLDNRAENLRSVTGVANRRNMPTQANNTSGITGINRRGVSWIVRIGVGSRGKRLHIGSFKCFALALKSRKDAEAQYGYHRNHGRR